MLIHSLWRCYAADKSFHSDATWQIHVVGKDHHTNHQTGTQLGKVRRTDMILLPPVIAWKCLKDRGRVRVK